MIGVHAQQPEGRPLAVAFLTEGTYPYAGGGVSTWSELLLSGLPTVDFHIIASTGKLWLEPRYVVPANVRSVTQVPLWGARPIDAMQRETGFVRLARARVRTTEGIIEREFVPSLRIWLRALFRSGEEMDLDVCGDAIVRMARFLRTHDYAAAFGSHAVWDMFKHAVGRWYCPGPAAARAHPEPSLVDVATTLQWLSALLRPLAIAPIQADVYHATVAASIGLLGIVARLEQGIPLLLTEHGVYYRERAISTSTDPALSLFQKHFLINLADTTARLCYRFADLIIPVCSFNAKWETRLGADPDRIRVIYNAVDTERFKPSPQEVEAGARPTVVSVGSVTPFKDLLTLIRAAALVRVCVPQVCFLVHGSLRSDPTYVEICRELIRALDLESVVRLEGVHPRPELAYARGDLTVLSSISEAFPFAVLESLACGRPVVATDVGGVAEALGDAGVTVPPGSPAALADAIVALLGDAIRRQTLGTAARARALRYFRLEQLLTSYGQTYASLAQRKIVCTQESEPL